MKMLQTHYDIMLAKMTRLAPLVSRQRAFIVAEGKSKDVEMRLRWDVWRAAGLLRFTCDTLYGYLNDTHIDTALRKIMKNIA